MGFYEEPVEEKTDEETLADLKTFLNAKNQALNEAQQELEHAKDHYAWKKARNAKEKKKIARMEVNRASEAVLAFARSKGLTAFSGWDNY